MSAPRHADSCWAQGDPHLACTCGAYEWQRHLDAALAEANRMAVHLEERMLDADPEDGARG